MKKYLIGFVASLLLFGGVVNAQDEPLGPDGDLDGVPDEVDQCLNSLGVGATVFIGECDSEVSNIVDEDGCTISDLISALITDCEDGAENHGEFVSCVSHGTNGLRPHVLSGAEKGAIQSCAAQSGIGGLQCEGCEANSSEPAENCHRARYELFENDLIIPCLDIGGGNYYAVDMNLSAATSNHFHFKVNKAEGMTQMEMLEVKDPEGTCAYYDLYSNILLIPNLQMEGIQYRVQMKLLGSNSANLHFKLEGITEVEGP